MRKSWNLKIRRALGKCWCMYVCPQNITLNNVVIFKYVRSAECVTHVGQVFDYNVIAILN
jgi:hypothetical protein